MKTDLHILALDGGGSKGIMEVLMLKHIMEFATLLKNKPEIAKKFLQKDVGNMKKFWQTTKTTPFELLTHGTNIDLVDSASLKDNWQDILEEIQDMKNKNVTFIHPVEAFDYIAGKFLLSSILLL